MGIFYRFYCKIAHAYIFQINLINALNILDMRFLGSLNYNRSDFQLLSTNKQRTTIRPLHSLLCTGNIDKLISLKAKQYS